MQFNRRMRFQITPFCRIRGRKFLLRVIVSENVFTNPHFFPLAVAKSHLQHLCNGVKYEFIPYLLPQFAFTLLKMFDNLSIC